MSKSVKLKQSLLLLGDVATLYFSLFITLLIRYGRFTEEIRESHLTPFTILFAVWLAIFYIAGFYEVRGLKNGADFAKKFSAAVAINFLVAILFFYFIPQFGITPKTNLFIFLALFAGAAYTWRTFYNNFTNTRTPAKKILLVGFNKAAQEVSTHLGKNPQLGYEIKFWMKEGLQDKEFKHLSQIIIANKINLIVVPAHIKKSSRAARLIYRNIALGIEVLDLAELYEMIFEKVPLAELEEVWFLENLAKSHQVYDSIKRPLELSIAFFLALGLLPLAASLALLIKVTSPGSAFFTQTRAGKGGKPFILWKFRTMIADAEKRGPKWAKPNDARATRIGKFLRRAHLDELPQLWNIITGDLSLVGPRPERPEFVATLQKEIPFYELRHLITPGLTGWAQLNYRYGASLDDAYEKLQYDIFYLKNRGPWLDFGILIKTTKRFFVSA